MIKLTHARNLARIYKGYNISNEAQTIINQCTIKLIVCGGKQH